MMNNMIMAFTVIDNLSSFYLILCRLLLNPMALIVQSVLAEISFQIHRNYYDKDGEIRTVDLYNIGTRNIHLIRRNFY